MGRSFHYINQAAPQQLMQASLHSVCTDFRLLFAFMRVILSSRIGRIARYTPSLTYNLTLPKRQKSARAN